MKYKLTYKNGIIGGYGVTFTGPDRLDLEGDYFDANTNLWLEHYPVVPLLYEHGMDSEMGARVIGEARPMRQDKVGVWYEAQLHERDAYEAAIMELVEAGKLGYSTGSLAHLVERASDGHLLSWPVAELTLTTTPAAGPYLTSVNVLRSHYKTLSQFGGNETMKKKWLAAAIKKFIPDISDEIADKIVDLLLLMQEDDSAPVTPTSSGQPDEQMRVMKSLLAFLQNANAGTDGVTPPLPTTGVVTEANVKAWIKDALTPYLTPTTQTPPAKTPPDPDVEAMKSVAALSMGETPAAVKAVTGELYGQDYDVQRYIQHQSYGRYCRYGSHALSSEQVKALKRVILTPAQIKDFVLSGGDIKALKADMSEAQDTLGGYLVPEDVRLNMIMRMAGLTVVREGADVTTTSRDLMTRVKVTGGDDRFIGAVRVTWVGDKPASGDARTNPTFAMEQTPIHLSMATIRVPRVLLEDNAYNLSGHLQQEVSSAYALDEDEQFLIGDGIAKPEGILPDGTNKDARLNEVVSGNASALTWGGVQAMRYGVARQYRQSAVWIMNDASALAIQQLVDGEGLSHWEPDGKQGEPDMLSGYPVLTSEAMPDIAANAYPILFGDRKAVQIADRVGMSVIRDETTYSEEDLVRFVYRRRLGAQLVAEWAIAAMKVSA